MAITHKSLYGDLNVDFPMTVIKQAVISAGETFDTTDPDQLSTIIQGLATKEALEEHDTLLNPHNLTAEFLNAASVDQLNMLREDVLADRQDMHIVVSHNADTSVRVALTNKNGTDTSDNFGILLIVYDPNNPDREILLDNGLLQFGAANGNKDFHYDIPRASLTASTAYQVRAYHRINSAGGGHRDFYSNTVLFDSSGTRAWVIDVYSRGATSAAVAKTWALALINSRPGDTLQVQWRQNYTYDTGNGTATGARRITNNYTL